MPVLAPERRQAKLGFRGRVGYRAAMSSQDIVIDARGHRCPVPTLRLRKALAEAPPGARVRLLSDDPMARIDVPHFVGEVGAEILAREETAEGFSFLVAKPGA
jgi:tRNA 2-thiouridine synthesizing protein A